MAEASFFEDSARKRVAESIAKVESQTSAEVVVAVRKRSGRYRDADFLFGFIVSLAVLCALLFLPHEFDYRHFPIDVLIGFFAGTVICANVPALRHFLAGRRQRDENVRTAALADFHELGITRTAGRTGLLVYVSVFERATEVVPDLAVDPEALGEGWTEAVRGMRAAAALADLDGFLASLEQLGPVLGQALPRADDDVNELPDEVHCA